ncbi:MAG: hypothetical protein GX801_03225 [Fibrobacter sp.]|nr:hypothetical protein [Fibrobacter sp.]
MYLFRVLSFIIVLSVSLFAQINLADLSTLMGAAPGLNLSASEIAAAKALMSDESTTSMTTMRRYDRGQTMPDSLAHPWQDSTNFIRLYGLKNPDSLHEIGGDLYYYSDSLGYIPYSLPEKEISFDDEDLPFGRYVHRFFARSLPSAFLERQNALTAEYPLKTGDVLNLILWGGVEREYELKLNAQGQVNVEGVGLVGLSGLSLTAAQQLLTNKLKKIHAGIASGRIKVSLNVNSLASTKVFVMGDVRQPGGYDLPGNSNVFLALYKAQGPSKIGSARKIKIIRAPDDSSETVDSLEIDLYRYFFYGEKEETAILRDGDMVFIPKAERLVKVTGDVGREAIFELKEDESLKDLMFYAGQANITAAHTLSLWRVMEDGRYDVLDLDSAQSAVEESSYELQNQDSLVVRASQKLPREYISVVGMVWYPGAYAFKAGENLKTIIERAGGLRPEAYLARMVVRRPLPDSTYAYLGDNTEANAVTLQAQDEIFVLDSGEIGVKYTVRISGAVKNPIMVDWSPEITVKTLIAMAGGYEPNHRQGFALIERLIPGADSIETVELTFSDGLNGSDPEDHLLKPYDRVVIPVDPNYYEQELVALGGAFKNPGRYALIKNRETFYDFMQRKAVLHNSSYLAGGRLFRKRDDTTYYQINFDLEQAFQGKLKQDLALQHGDSIYVPTEQLTVQLKGEVVSPGDVLWSDGWRIKDYLNAVGGLTRNGDDERIIITYADGRKSTMSRAPRNPDPGSIITVSYKEVKETDWFRVWTTVATILGTVAQLMMAYAVVYEKSN